MNHPMQETAQQSSTHRGQTSQGCAAQISKAELRTRKAECDALSCTQLREATAESERGNVHLDLLLANSAPLTTKA